MNNEVASLTLCEELYKLSGWEDTQRYYDKNGDTWTNLKSSITESEPGFACYAYSLGFMLRKLPRTVFLTGHSVGWSAEVGLFVSRDTTSPENAACKLAIELFKSGVLSREEK